MAELLIGGTAAAATAGTAATTASTALTILSGVATAVGVLGTLSAASAEASGFRMEAMHTETEAGQQQLQSQQRQTNIKRELMRVLGENDVTIAAAGIDLSGGYAKAQRTAAQQGAVRALNVERQDDEHRRALLKARAQGLRTKARGVQQAGLLRAVGQVADYGFDVLERG